MNYAQCVESLASLGHELHGVKFGLHAIRRILQSLGHPESRYPTAIVAGTNGKGSTSAMLAGILEAAGYRTGLYTSPHLTRVNERIRVNGEEIGDEDFAVAFTEVWQATGRLLEKGMLPTRPSFFEYLTAAAFLRFARAEVNFAVLEVGMGGRLDATNVTEPRVAVITNIALDHQAYLGSTLAAIAGEKAGVIKAGRPVISASEDPEAREVIRRRAGELGAPLIETPASAEISNLRARDGRYTFDLALNGVPYRGLALPLMGRFQVKNAVAATAAAQELSREGWNISENNIREGLRRTRWPGRLEVASQGPLVVLDGAHNPAAALEIARFIREEWAGKPLRLVYASMRDKAIGEISALLFPLAAKVYLTQPNPSRAAKPAEILAAAASPPCEVALIADPAQALACALRESSPEDIVLVAGSLFLVAEIKKALAEAPLPARALEAQAASQPR